jgi:hypothetical protein
MVLFILLFIIAALLFLSLPIPFMNQAAASCSGFQASSLAA